MVCRRVCMWRFGSAARWGAKRLSARAVRARSSCKCKYKRVFAQQIIKCQVSTHTYSLAPSEYIRASALLVSKFKQNACFDWRWKIWLAHVWEGNLPCLVQKKWANCGELWSRCTWLLSRTSHVAHFVIALTRANNERSPCAPKVTHLFKVRRLRWMWFRDSGWKC